MDEPFAALDEITRLKLNDDLLDAVARGRADGGLRHAQRLRVGVSVDPHRGDGRAAGARRGGGARSTRRIRATRRSGPRRIQRATAGRSRDAGARRWLVEVTCSRRVATCRDDRTRSPAPARERDDPEQARLARPTRSRAWARLSGSVLPLVDRRRRARGLGGAGPSQAHPALHPARPAADAAHAGQATGHTLCPSLLVTLADHRRGPLVAAMVGRRLIAILFAQSKWIELSLFPYAVILQVTPIVAIAPLIIIWVKNTCSRC